MDREPASPATQPSRPQPTRRQVLRGAGAGVGAAALAPVLAGPAQAGTQAAGAVGPEPTGRSLNFNLGWKFALVTPDGVTDPTGAYANAYQPGFDDSGWRALDLPHDWSIELDPVADASTVSGNGFFPGGLGWYRKTFTLPPSMAGKRISVEFDGVYMNANVYLNGKLLGNHPYAYTGFNYDLTGQVHTDGRTPNVIAVQASNQIPSSRWYSGSGIYRNVHLIVTGPVHVARHGTFVTTPGLASTAGSGYGNAQIQTIVQNDGAAGVPATVMVRVRDARGAVVGNATATVTVPAGQTATATSAVRVGHPALWSVDDPALYSVESDVVTNGVAVDSITVSFGFRYFDFDPDQGFSLNGQHMKLQGVDLHATQGPLGAVIRPDALVRQMTIMKSMGVNALRTAHNPPAPELTAVCERLGIVMMVEAFDCWHTGKLPYDYHLYFDAWSDSDIKEMVNAHKNSPAVVMWSIGNETPDTGRPGGPAIAQRLIADVKSIDTTRPVVMGSDQYRSVPRDGSPQDQIVRMLGRARRQLQHGHVHGRAARQVRHQVLLLLGDGVRNLDPRLLPGSATAEHRGELHAGQVQHVVVRQQPVVVVHERRVRAQERPGPAVLGGRVPVERAGLHRRADAVQPVPGQGVVLRRGRHGRVPEGRVLPVRQPVGRRADGARRTDELDRPRGGG
jgi:beta-galactosidase